MNAAILGQAFSDFQKVSGALQQDGKTGVVLHTITGKTYGTAPMYGELPYQYYKSKYGYELGLEKIETEKRLKNLIPNKVPIVGELFNAIP